MFGQLLPDEAINAVRADYQIARGALFYACDVGLKAQVNAQLGAARLQYVEQAYAGDAGEVVAANRYLPVAVEDIHVIPRLEALRDTRMRHFVRRAQVAQGLPRKDHAPPERAIGRITLINRNLMRRVEPLHQQREVQARRPAADNRYSHRQ